jgi:hypothetical protein
MDKVALADTIQVISPNNQQEDSNEHNREAAAQEPNCSFAIGEHIGRV